MSIPPGYSAFCLDRQLAQAVGFRPELDRIRLLVNEPGNLSVLQGLQLYALCREYRPDVVFELGRGYGNSACVFASAIEANRCGRLVSFDLDSLWHDLTLPNLNASGFATIASHVDARTQDISTVDFRELVGDAKKVFVFWDAHGWEAAEGVLCRLMPAISGCDHIVACHDASDSRHVEVPRSYDGRFFWRGPDTKEISARYNIGWLNTQEPQFLPLMDFLWRNECEMHSADEDLVMWRRSHAAQQVLVEQTIGADVFAPGCHWTYFSLNDAKAKLTFPTQMHKAPPVQESVPAQESAPAPRPLLRRDLSRLKAAR
jgi:hypothetical protein